MSDNLVPVGAGAPQGVEALPLLPSPRMEVGVMSPDLVPSQSSHPLAQDGGDRKAMMKLNHSRKWFP
jgi:hypothetical protein